MQNKFSKIILSFSLVFIGSFFFSVKNAEAVCVINQASFRAINSQGQSITQFSVDGWYEDNLRPYVYIDVQTSGCNGQTVEFSLTESDAPGTNAWVDDDVNGFDFSDQGILNSATGGCSPSQSYCLDNRPIPIGSAPAESNFTIVLQTGEDECDVTSGVYCIYYVRFNDDPVPTSAEFINQVLNLRYNCDTACDEDWVWIQKIEFGGTHPNDPALQSASEGEEPATPGIAGQDIDINIINPIGPSNMTLVDFIEKVIKFALTIGIPIIAIAIIYSGLLFVTARGNDSQLETAKNAFTYAVIGGAILLGSFIFAKLIKETIESIAMISSYFV